ncbi:MAG: hypothetical protein QXO12_03115 [Candidatus Pacearchaeota archaeon]
MTEEIKKQEALPTQKLIEIKEIKDNTVYLKDGGLCKIIMVNSINFDLKSEIEQDLILENFKNFLNSLDFSIQILIHSRKTNIENYLNMLKNRQNEEENDLLKIQIEDYIDFINNFVQENNIVSKRFFIIVRYDPTIINNKTFSFFKKTNSLKEDNFTDQEKLEQLEERVITIEEGLNQLGLNYYVLDDESLIELFYNIYNPEIIDKRNINL